MIFEDKCPTIFASTYHVLNAIIKHSINKEKALVGSFSGGTVKS